tara:strand:- start:67 stop:369 length:303 start_codon:yes stop_codon:yes gene_type:complete
MSRERMTHVSLMRTVENPHGEENIVSKMIIKLPESLIKVDDDFSKIEKVRGEESIIDPQDTEEMHDWMMGVLDHFASEYFGWIPVTIMTAEEAKKEASNH